MNERYEIPAKPENIEKAVRHIDELLSARNISSKKKTKSILIAEETIARLIEHADEGTGLVIESHGIFGNINLSLKSRGSSFDIDDIENHLLFEGDPGEDGTENDVIHRFVDRVFWDRLSIRNYKGINHAQIKVTKSAYSGILYTLLALVAGILIGLMLKFFASEDISSGASEYVFTPVFNIFMNALKMMIGPLVFCSIASSIADFTDIKALGKIAIKVVVAYVITSAVAISVGYLVSFLLPAGNPDLIQAVGDQASGIVSAGETTDTSILGTIVGIVPSDIISPFMNNNMLQLIFLAVVLGVTGASLHNRIPGIRNVLSVMNKACSAIVAYIVKFVPVMVICSMAKMMLSIDIEDLKDQFAWVPINYLGCIIMLCFYAILLIVVGRINPLTFFKKFSPAMLTAFSMNSSSAALPTSLAMCDKLGISRRISSFSIPLGATINMDGSCITLMISAFFMAGIYGVSIDSSLLTSLLISVMALSLGCPGIPGAGMVCMTILFPQFGVPADAVALVMGVYPLIGMIQTATNVTGDAVVTTIIARQEKLLDLEKYNSK